MKIKIFCYDELNELNKENPLRSFEGEVNEFLASKDNIIDIKLSTTFNPESENTHYQVIIVYN